MNVPRKPHSSPARLHDGHRPGGCAAAGARSPPRQRPRLGRGRSSPVTRGARERLPRGGRAAPFTLRRGHRRGAPLRGGRRARGGAPRGSRSAAAFPNPDARGGRDRPPRTSQPRASPSAESSGASVQMEMGGNVEIERRAARPATSSSQRGQSLSLLKREHAARPSPAYRNVSSRAPLQETSGDDGDGRNTNASNERRPRFTNSHTAVYNRLLAESAARRVRARPRNNDTEPPHAQDTHTWRVNFEDGVGSPGPPPHPRLGNRPHHSSHNTTEDEGGGYWGATEPEEGGNTDAYDVPDHDGFDAMDGLGRLGVAGARRSRRRGGNLAARVERSRGCRRR